MAVASLAVPLRAARTSKPGLCALIMLAGDIGAVSISMAIAVLARHAFGGSYDLALYGRLSGLLLFFTAGYGFFGLYPGIAHNPIQEMRQLTRATTLVFVLIATVLFLLKEGHTYSRSVFLIAWLLALALAPLMRVWLRTLFGRRSWWGYPVALFGNREDAARIAAELSARPEGGLHPAAIFVEGDGGPGGSILGIPVFSGFHAAPLQARRLGLKHAIVALPGRPSADLTALLETHANMFSHLYLLPGLTGFSSLAVETRDVSGAVMLELRRSLLLTHCQFVKRAIDQCISLTLGVILLPLMLLIALLIRLESRGGALYAHKRIGYGGRQFKIWKFRTMYADSSSLLERYLAERPEERAAWAANRKLRNDPRVTPFGRFLRKTSLDELPQLWNVLRGEMSLVGPRPIVGDEVPKYGEWFDFYCRVMPGLTGLWQVSGRSGTTYAERVALDSYYVRNWSPWFDIYLLARTAQAVWKGEGAY